MKKILSIVLALTLAISANAVSVQKIRLKNGSVLYGFIQRQYGDGKLLISTDSAVICLKKNHAKMTVEEKKSWNAVPDVWKQWAENHDAVDGSGDQRTFSLCTIQAYINPSDTTAKGKDFETLLSKSGKLFANVRLLEKGSYFRFLEITKNSYEVHWSDIESVRADRRPKNALSGIDRKYYLTNGREISGQYAGESETTLSLYQFGNVVETVDFDDVKRYTFSAINPAQEIFAQSELLDVVHTSNLGTVYGVIIEQNYTSDKDVENYISIWEKGKSPQMIKISDVVSISREENPDYAPLYDIILKKGEVVINREQIQFVKVSDTSDYLVLDSIGERTNIKMGADGKAKITVEYRDDTDSNVEIFQLIKIEKIKVKKEEKYGFSYKNLVNYAIRAASVDTSVNHTVKAQYTVTSAGPYALYDAKKKRVSIIVVK